MSTILVILIGLGIIVLCGMAIKYSESAVSLLILLPGVLLGIVMLLLTVEHSNDRKENVRDIISNFTKTYCTPVKITSISLIQYLPDGCSEYMVIAVTRDSTYTYSAVLDPEKLKLSISFLRNLFLDLKTIKINKTMAKNRLFGWMFVEDSNKEPKPTVEPVKQEISVVVPTPTPPIVAAGDVDTKLVELLERKINEANLPGPDYLELLQSAEQMRQYIPDETTRLKAAFGSIQGMDPRMTKEVVLASIDTYLGVIEAERGKAKLRMEKLRKETVEDKVEELKATNLRIEQLREELKTLTDKSIDLNSEIQKNTAETTAFEARTNATIDKVTNRLNEDKTRLAQIL